MKRAAARLLLLAGAIGVGLLLLRASPRDVTFVYDVGRLPGATALEVEIRRDGETIRHAELRVAPGAAQVEHRVRLPDGTYDLAVRVARPGAPVRVDRPIEIREAGTIVVPLGG